MTRIKSMVVTALFIAAGITLPMTLHAIPGAGPIFLPMHIPVLLCGILCGLPYGLLCGAITPLLSSLTGMPPAAMLPSMICELAVYGTVSALLIKWAPIKNLYAKIYIALLGAMLAGRLTYGVLNALFFRAGNYSLEIWTAAAFFTALPGIAAQIIIIPVVVVALHKAKLV